MKKLIVIFLTAITLFSATTTVLASEIEPASVERITVKVGYLDDYGIITTPIVQGSEGFGYEYLEKLEAYTFYDFEYVDVSWAEGLEKLKNGEIDLLAPATMNEQRKEFYDFVDTIFSHEETNVYALENSEYNYDEPTQIDGKIIGTIEGSVYEERFKVYAKENGLSYTLIYSDPATVFEDLTKGKIDLYIDGSLHLRTGVHAVDKIHTEQLYLMTKKGNDALKNALNSAMVELEDENPFYNELLWYKYYANEHKANRKFTTDEITALQSKDIYTVGYHADSHPISYTLNGEPKGYAIDVMNILAEKLDIKIKYIPLHDGNENSAENIDFNLCAMNDEGALYGTLSEPYYTQKLLIATDKGLQKSDVKNILIPNYSTVRIEDYLEQFPSATVHKANSVKDSKNIYDKVDIDCFIVPESSEMFIKDKANMSLSVFDASLPIGITVSNKLPNEVLNALNKSIVALKESTVDELVFNNVVSLQKEPSFTETLIKYQFEIASVLLLIITLFIVVLLKHHKKTRRLLEVDTLTGVMSLYKFAQETQRILQSAKPNEYMLILLDVDKFKTINKSYGTTLGDKLLCALVDSIKRRTNDGSVMGRVQGDVFAILTKATRIPEISQNRHFIDDQFVEELKLIGIAIPVYFSIGVYLIEKTTDDISFMLDNARTAKGYGKTIFGNTINYFTKELQAKHEKESAILSSMESALKDEELFIVIQPKLDLQTEMLVGGEVLIRWKQKDGTFIYPDEFIPLMEENKFIIHLDKYVLEKTCEFIRDSKLDLPVLSINVSAITMLEPYFLYTANEVLQRYGIKPQQIEVELTESVLDADFKRISNIISELKKLGVTIAIDDFGKGASSLARFKEIEVDVLKLDKDFIDNNAWNEKGQLILNNILSMAQDLEITSLAEGIETKEHQDLLVKLGCKQGQGYYFNKPLSPEDFLQRVESNNGNYTALDFSASNKIKGYMTNFDYLPYAMAITQNDPDYTVLKANSLFYEIIGYTKSELLQKHQNRLSEIFWGAHHLDICSQTYGEDINTEFDFRVKTATGDIVWLHNHMHYDANRDLFFCNVIDITNNSNSGEIPLSFDAYKAHIESLKWLEQHTKEYIVISDVETGDVVYLNHRVMDYWNYHDEIDWQGKKHYDIAFGSEANIDDGYYQPVPEDCFVSREYYNTFHNMYLHVESRIITVLGRKMRLEINSDITAQKQVESEHSLQNTLHKCVEYLYTTTANTTIDKTDTYELLLQQIKLHYDADRAYFYKFKDASAEVDEHYEVISDGITSGKNELKSLPLTIREKLIYQLQQNNLLIKKDLEKFEPWEIERVSAIYAAHGVDLFVYGAVKDAQGKVVGFMGVDNPKEDKDNANLMLLLSRFVWLFVKNEETKKFQANSNKLLQESMAHEQELTKLDEMSNMNVLDICQKKLQGIAHEKEQVISVLTALRHHYGANFVTVLEFSPDNKTYSTIYESLEEGIPSIVEECRACSIALLQTAITNFTDNMKFAVSAKDISMLTDDEREIWNKYGIVNTTSAPLYDRHNELFGMLCVNNITIDRRSKALIYSVAKNIADYLITVNIHQESIQDSLTGLLNKKETELRISNCLEQGTGGVMFIIDMDSFKSINDNLGHMVGDEMLEVVSNSIKETFRSTDVQGRIGGDEFMVFCPNPITDELVKQKATNILSRCNQTYERDGIILETSCTIGIARAKEVETFQNIYQEADKALYTAKQQGKNQYYFVTKE